MVIEAFLFIELAANYRTIYSMLSDLAIYDNSSIFKRIASTVVSQINEWLNNLFRRLLKLCCTIKHHQ